MMQRWGQVTSQPALAAVSSGQELLALRQEVDRVHVAPEVHRYILSLVRADPHAGRAHRQSQRQAPAQFRRLAARLARPLPVRPRARLAARRGFRLARRSCRNSRPTSCATASASPTRPRPRRSPPTGSSARSSSARRCRRSRRADRPRRMTASARLNGSTARKPPLRVSTRRVRNRHWPCCAGWSGACGMRSKMCSAANTARPSAGAAWSSTRWSNTSSATTCATSTGMSPRASANPTARNSSRNARSRCCSCSRIPPACSSVPSDLSKREALLELAGLVMLLGAVNRDRVGYVYAAPDGYHLREPVRGRGPILHAASTLLGMPPPALQDQPARAGNRAGAFRPAVHRSAGRAAGRSSPGGRPRPQTPRRAAGLRDSLAASGPRRAAAQHPHLALRLSAPRGARGLGRAAPPLQHHGLSRRRSLGARPPGRRPARRLRSAGRPPGHARRHGGAAAGHAEWVQRRADGLSRPVPRSRSAASS